MWPKKKAVRPSKIRKFSITLIFSRLKKHWTTASWATPPSTPPRLPTMTLPSFCSNSAGPQVVDPNFQPPARRHRAPPASPLNPWEASCPSLALLVLETCGAQDLHCSALPVVSGQHLDLIWWILSREQHHSFNHSFLEISLVKTCKKSSSNNN